MIHSILPVQFMCLMIFCTTCLQASFGLTLVLEPSTSYSIHFFTQSLSSFCKKCPYHRNLFCCSNEIMSSILTLSLSLSLSTLYLNSIFYLNITHRSNHSHICPLKCTSSSFLTSQVSLPRNTLLCIQLLYSLSHNP